MKIALLGADPAALTLAQAVARSTEHELIWACELGESEPDLRALCPRLQTGEPWEALLSGALAEAVIVARSENDDLRAEQLRKLVQAGVPLLLSHPIHDSMLVYYELEMIRKEKQCVLLPYLPARWHPAVARLRGVTLSADETGIGTLSQVIFERTTPDRSEREVLAHFARDVDLVRSLCGDITSLAAMKGASAAEYESLGVQMSGPAGPLVRWSLEPAGDVAGGRLTMIGSRGKAVLQMPDGECGWELLVTGDDVHERQAFSPARPATDIALTKLTQAMAGEPVHPDWVDAARSVELAETVKGSLAKGRTVQMHYEDYTEEATFKGVMAAAGCGLLCAAIISLLAAAVLAKLGLWWAGYWPHALCALFVIFLLLQLFRLILPPERH